MLESTLRRLIFARMAMGGALIEATATGNPLTFLTDKAKPLKSLVANFLPVQSGTDDPSPSNVRPITGWTGVKFEHFDSNLLTINRSSAQETQGITYTPIKQDNKTVAVKVEGTRTSNNPFFNLNYVNGSTVSIAPGTYKIFGGSPEVRIQVFYKDSGGTEQIAGQDTGEGATATIPADAMASWCRLLVPVNTPVDAVIYPIVMSADSSVNVHSVVFPAMGKNLLNPATLMQGGINIDGSDTAVRMRVKTDFIPIKENTVYIASAGSGFKVFMHFYDAEKASMGANVASKSTSPLGACYVRVIIGFTDDADIVPSDVTTGQLEESTQSGTATEYEPFKPVYGGVFDAVTGVLTVEWAGYSAKWKNGTDASDRGTVTRKKFPLPFQSVTASTKQTGFCNVGKWKWNFDSDDTHFYATGSNSYVFLPNDTDGETDIQIIAQLATPQEIQLTPEQITALVGENTIWSDTNGENTVIYLKKA